MNKNELYEKLLDAFKDHSNKNTLQTTYVNRVLRIVKKYLQYDELKEVVDAQEILIEHLKIQREQLKQALEFLEKRLGVKLNGCINGGYSISIQVNDKLINPNDTYLIYMFKEQYELLKEVLKDE